MTELNKNRDLKLQEYCLDCKKGFELLVVKADYVAWQKEKLIQKAMPYLSPGERELLISGICGECFDGMFEQNLTKGI